MAKLKTNEKKAFEKLVENRVLAVRRYRNLINALVACYNYFRNKHGYKCYLGGKIDGLSPDIIVKSDTQKDIIGDGKKGLPMLPKKEESENWEQFENREDVRIYKERILKKLNDEISKYSKNIKGISKDHDFFILCPSDSRTPIKRLDKEGKINNDVIVLSFSFTNDDTYYVLRIEKERGDFSDEEINNDFELNSGINYRMQDSAELISKQKLYLAEKEDYNAPIEWIMLVIWQYILPEAAHANEKEMILMKLKDGHIIVEVELKQISDFIKDNYLLPTFNGKKTQISYGIIRTALSHISKLTQVSIVNGKDSANPKYRINWTKISSNNLLYEFVRKVNEDAFEIEAKKQANNFSEDKKDLKQKDLKDY